MVFFNQFFGDNLQEFYVAEDYRFRSVNNRNYTLKLFVENIIHCKSCKLTFSFEFSVFTHSNGFN